MESKYDSDSSENPSCYQRGGRVRGRKKKLITLKATQKQIVNINLTRGRGGGGTKRPPKPPMIPPSFSFQQPINFGNLQGGFAHPLRLTGEQQQGRPERFYDMIRDSMRPEQKEPNQPQRGLEPPIGRREGANPLEVPVNPPPLEEELPPLEDEKEELPPPDNRQPVEEEPVTPPLFEKSQVDYDISRIGELPVGSGKQSQGTKQEIIAILAKYNIVLKPTVYSKSLNIIKEKAIKKLAALNV